MKAKILEINGKEKGKIELPNIFSAEVREDIVEKVLEAKKQKQPYGPSVVAGKQHAAKGKIVHRRKVWRSGYGRGISRVPRKIFSQRGSNFNWEAAEVPQARGGMRAHPPKPASMINVKKINKKERKIAFESAVSATIDKRRLEKKYERIEKIEKGILFIFESKIVSLKTKELVENLRKVLGENLFEIALKKKSMRSGKGKLRGRKYKSNAGLLFVIGEKEKLKTGIFDIVDVKKLGVNDLAKGGLGRLTIWTENAIKELGGKND